MDLKLKRLVIITCLAMAGIIAVQVFWIYTAYVNQKNKLRTVTEEKLIITQVLTGASPSVRSGAQSIAVSILGEVSNGLLQIDKNSSLEHAELMDSALMAISNGDTGIVKDVLSRIGLDGSTATKQFSLFDFKNVLAKELDKAGIGAPFELAVVDAKENIIKTTSNKLSFKNATVLTSLETSLPVHLKDKLSGRIRVGYPDATWYLMHGIGNILYLSVVLALICIGSFSLMLSLFYKQKRLSAIKTDFMSNMTHELKTPISTISIALELLQDEVDPPTPSKKKEYFQIAASELKRLNQLLTKVLRMAAFEKMQVVLHKKHFKVKDWINDVVNATATLMENKQVDLMMDVNPEDIELYADERQLASLLHNLLENAVKYRHPDKAILHIVIKARIINNQFVLSVGDNGIGIATKYQDKVFDKFYRVTSGYEHDTKGYGLGLSHAKEIAHLHGGSLQLQSVMNEGTTFSFILPQHN